MEAPAVWKQQYRDKFGKYATNQEYRDLLTTWQDQWKDNQGYITRKEQEFADHRRRFEPIGEVISPYEQVWASQGLSPDQGLRSVMAAYQQLNQDPQGTLIRLAQHYGVDLESAYAEQPYVPPEVQGLQQQLQQVQSQFQQQQQAFEQQQYARLNQEIQAFQTAVDEHGNPKAPHFESVFNSMVQLARAGLATSIQEAYDKAVALNPELRAQIATQQQQAQAVTRAAEANRALEASKTVKSKGAEGRPPARSAHDDYAAALSGQ